MTVLNLRKHPVEKLAMACRDTLSALMTGRDLGGLDAAEKIHETRVRIKRLRALIRLMRGFVPPLPSPAAARLERLKSVWRDAARKLGPIRDEDVSRKLGLKPRKIHTKRERAQALQKIRQAALASAEDVNHVLTIAEFASETRALRFGLKASFKKAKKRYARYKKTGEPADLHEWRKRVKDLQYQLVAVTSGDGAKPVYRRLKKLGQNLGDAHDMILAGGASKKFEKKSLKRAGALFGKMDFA